MSRLRIFGKWIGVEVVEVSLAEKLVAALGGGLAIAALAFFTHLCLAAPAATAVVASMGASAVLLFAVPHGQLSQPWPVIAGHVVSAGIGVACSRWIPEPHWAAAAAVGLSIGAMLLFKCVHPPGGATAFTAVMGGPAIHDLGFAYVWCPVGMNAVIMVLLAVAINAAFRWRRYPAALHAAAQAPRSPDAPVRVVSSGVVALPPSHEEVLSAVRSLDSFVDITEEDLVRLTELLSASASSASGQRDTTA